MTEYMAAFLAEVFYEPLAYLAGLMWCFSVALIVLRSIDRMFRAKTEERR